MPMPLLSLHALAAQRGDGLRPELLELFARHARPCVGLSVSIESEPHETLIQEDPYDQSLTGDASLHAKGR